MAQRVEYLPALPETWVRSLGWEDPLEKKMATHSGTPFMDGEAWWATAHVVAKSGTRLSNFTDSRQRRPPGSDHGKS